MTLPFVKYNAGVTSNVTDPTFTRDVTCRDPRGVDCAVDERRYGQVIGFCPDPGWVDSGVDVPGGPTARVIGSGWDHDGTTPVLIVDDISGNTIRILSGATPTAGTTFTGSDALNGQADDVAGTEYNVRASIIYHGLMVFLAERTTGGVIVGTSLLYSTDLGVTRQRVPQAAIDGGTGYDVPANAEAAGADEDAVRGQFWCFQNPFPAEGQADETTLDVWFPWTDYLHAGVKAKGGQCGVFRATRTAVGEPWILQRNRLLHEEWDAAVGDAPNVHWHGLSLVSAGFLLQQGDSPIQNRTHLIAVDHDTYATADVTATVIQGDLSATNAVEKHAPQQVSVAPGPTYGSTLACGDWSGEVMTLTSDIKVATDAVVVRELVRRNNRVLLAGKTYEGSESLSMHWQSGAGWVCGGVDVTTVEKSDCWATRDGEVWGEIPYPPGDFAGVQDHNLWHYGYQLCMVDDNNNIWLADKPSVEAIEPLCINRGGTNRLDEDLTEGTPITSPHASVTANYATYDGTNFLVSGSPITKQPAQAPPFPNDTPILHITCGTSWTVGTYWLSAAAASEDWSTEQLLTGYLFNLTRGEQGSLLRLDMAHTPFGTGAPSDWTDNRRFFDSESDRWFPFAIYGKTADGATSRGALRIRIPSTLNIAAPGGEYLLAFTGFFESPITSYPLEQGVTGADEIETFANFTCTDAWSVNLIMQWPADAVQVDSGEYLLATLREDDDNYVKITFTPTGSFTADIDAEFYVATALEETVTVAVDLLPTQILDLVVTQGAGNWGLSARNAGEAIVTGTPDVIDPSALNPIEVLWASDATGSQVDMVRPIFAQVNESYALDTEQIASLFQENIGQRTTAVITPADVASITTWCDFSDTRSTNTTITIGEILKSFNKKHATNNGDIAGAPGAAPTSGSTMGPNDLSCAKFVDPAGATWQRLRTTAGVNEIDYKSDTTPFELWIAIQFDADFAAAGGQVFGGGPDSGNEVRFYVDGSGKVYFNDGVAFGDFTNVIADDHLPHILRFRVGGAANSLIVVDGVTFEGPAVGGGGDEMHGIQVGPTGGGDGAQLVGRIGEFFISQGAITDADVETALFNHLNNKWRLLRKLSVSSPGRSVASAPVNAATIFPRVPV